MLRLEGAKYVSLVIGRSLTVGVYDETHPTQSCQGDHSYFHYLVNTDEDKKLSLPCF